MKFGRRRLFRGLGRKWWIPNPRHMYNVGNKGCKKEKRSNKTSLCILETIFNFIYYNIGFTDSFFKKSIKYGCYLIISLVMVLVVSSTNLICSLRYSTAFLALKGLQLKTSMLMVLFSSKVWMAM